MFISMLKLFGAVLKHENVALHAYPSPYLTPIPVQVIHIGIYLPISIYFMFLMAP